jgi:HlyD family secretion protein
MFEKIKFKKVIFIAIIAGLAIFLFFVIRSCTQGIDLVYGYNKAAMGDVHKTITVTGKLEILDGQAVLSRIGGIINSIHADFNQQVTRGQLLATIDPIDIEQNILRVETQLERANLDVEEGVKELDAKRDLMKENLISRKEMDLAELKFKKIEAAYKQIKTEYNIAIKTKSYTKIYSPISGIIISMEIEPKKPVAQNQPLFIIAQNLKKMKLLINIDESDIGNVKKGMPVIFSVNAYPGKSFKGEISQVRISPINSGGMMIYQSLIICDNNELLLKPGMSPIATIFINTRKNVLMVPNQAFMVSPPVNITVDPNKKYLWKKKPSLIGKLPVERVEVQIGLAGDQYTEIISPSIKASDDILVSIHKKLEVKDELSSYGK